MKRLLAYSSIENIGIVLIGLGIAALGKSSGNQTRGDLRTCRRTAPHAQPLAVQIAALLRSRQHTLPNAHHLARCAGSGWAGTCPSRACCFWPARRPSAPCCRSTGSSRNC
ncbi:MAG: hypothetical protein ACLRSE_01280 [Alistipes finegoldii]